MAGRSFIYSLSLLLIAFYVYGSVSSHELMDSTFNALGDELLGLWIFHKLSANLLSFSGDVFDGGVFYPTLKTLAFAESMLVPSLGYRLIYTLVGHKVLAYHLTVLGTFFLNFVSMFFLCRKFFGKFAAWFGAIVFALSMMRVAQLSHIQLLPQFFFPLTVYFIIEYEKKSELKYLIWASVSGVLQMLSGIYLGIILLVSLVPYFVCRLYFKRDSRKKYLTHSVVAGIVFLIGFGPVAYQYRWVESKYGLKRRVGDARTYGANEMNYVSAPKGSLFYPVTKHLQRGQNQHEKYLFLGFVVLFFAFLSLRHLRRQTGSEYRYYKALIFSSLIFIIVMSMGPNALIYNLFYYGFPGMKALRVPSRFGFAYLFLMAWLCAWGLQLFLNRYQGKLQVQKAIALGVLSVFLLENWVPVKFLEVPTELKGASDYLSRLEKGARGPVAHLPIRVPYKRYAGDQGNAFNNRETVRMFYSLEHQNPILNGYSGFVPKSLKGVIEVESTSGPSLSLITALKDRGFRYVVVDKNILPLQARKVWLSFMKQQNVVFEDEATLVIDLA